MSDREDKKEVKSKTKLLLVMAIILFFSICIIGLATQSIYIVQLESELNLTRSLINETMEVATDLAMRCDELNEASKWLYDTYIELQTQCQDN